MTRLPAPDWSRPGETWRIEEEAHLVVGTGWCTSKRCTNRAVAVSLRSGMAAPDQIRFRLCREHLAELSIWVEGNRVVSWCLRP